MSSLDEWMGGWGRISGRGNRRRSSLVAGRDRRGAHDLDAPVLGTQCQAAPREGAGHLGLELVIQRARVVVVDQFHRLARLQRAERGEDAGVPLGRGDLADVEDRSVDGLRHGLLRSV